MTETTIRTTAFRVNPAEMGRVHVYRAGAEFGAAWTRLVQLKRATRSWRMPTASLVAVLRVRVGDFVHLDKEAGEPWLPILVARTRITPSVLQAVLLAWEYVSFPDAATGDLAKAAHDLRVEKLDVWDAVRIRPGTCPEAPSWVWNAARWEVANQLAKQPLALNASMTGLRRDSDGALLTWSDPVGRDDRPGRALHKVLPRLIAVPGLEAPAIHLDATVTRLATSWRDRPGSAWVDVGKDKPLLRLGIRSWNGEVSWQDQAAEVLRQSGPSGRLPDPSTIDLAWHDRVRATFAKTPDRFPVGSGPGQMFHESVALHMRRQLPNWDPVDLTKAVRQLPRPLAGPAEAKALRQGVSSTGSERLRLVCLYATDEGRHRVVGALAEFTKSEGIRRVCRKDLVLGRTGPFDVVFVSAVGARDVLLRNGTVAEIRRWTLDQVKPWRADGEHATCVIVETLSKDREGKGEDPKFVIRQALAEHGMVSQFLCVSSIPTAKKTKDEDDDQDDDHAASRSVWDVMRSAGVFPRLFPALDTRIPKGTWLFGLYCLEPRKGWTQPARFAREQKYTFAMTAVEAGTQRTMGLAPNGKWVALHQATAAIQAQADLLEKRELISRVEGALSRHLAAHPSDMGILFADADGCRRFWRGFADTGDRSLPLPSSASRLAVVRVRTGAKEVPRPAGLGPWVGALGPGKPRTINALLRLKDEDYGSAWFYASTPRAMSVMGEHRHHTRFSVDQRSLKHNWHSLNMTEFSCRRPGPFAQADIYQLSAMLCRQAPTWDGTLDWPSPPHLARAILDDHPARFFNPGEEGPDENEPH